MESTPPAIEHRVADRIRALRAERGLTLGALAERSGVSRSMISVIERAESSPTASVLDRLAAALGVTIATLFAEAKRPNAAPVARAADQPLWSDPETGYVRRNLSPAGFPSAIELVEVTLPPGARVAYDTGSRLSVIDQQIWVIAGAIAITVGDTTHDLATGDCLAMRLDRPITFRNRTGAPARYMVALTTRTSRSIP